MHFDRQTYESVRDFVVQWPLYAIGDWIWDHKGWIVSALVTGIPSIVRCIPVKLRWALAGAAIACIVVPLGSTLLEHAYPSTRVMVKPASEESGVGIPLDCSIDTIGDVSLGDSTSTMVIVEATVWNRDVRRPSVASGFALKITLSSGAFIIPVTQAFLARQLNLHGPPGETHYSWDQQLALRALKPIPPGGSVSGVLLFSATGLEEKNFDLPGTVAELSFTDVDGKPHKCGVEMSGLEVKHKFHPGLSVVP